jgi:hypothetical protein
MRELVSVKGEVQQHHDFCCQQSPLHCPLQQQPATTNTNKDPASTDYYNNQ